jgi:hypothetical protein
MGESDTRGRKQDAAIRANKLRDLGQLSPRFRNIGRPKNEPESSPSGYPSPSRDAGSTTTKAPAPQISKSARGIAAMLGEQGVRPEERAAEAAEAMAGQRLAARFVKTEAEKAGHGGKGSMAPYLAAGAFVLLAAGASAYFFMAPDLIRNAGGSYVAASFTSPFSSGPAQEPPAWAPKLDGRGPGSPGWTETVQTFRALSAPAAPALADKVAEPQLEKLAGSYAAGP